MGLDFLTLTKNSSALGATAAKFFGKDLNRIDLENIHTASLKTSQRGLGDQIVDRHIGGLTA